MVTQRLHTLTCPSSIRIHDSIIPFVILINVVRLDVVIGLSMRTHEFNSRPTHLKSVFGKVSFRQVLYSDYFGFLLSVSFCHASYSFTYHRRYVTLTTNGVVK